MRNRILLSMGLICLAGYAFADQTFNVTAVGRKISQIAMIPSDQIEGDDCSKTSANGADVYTCKISLAGNDDSLRDYKLSLQGEDLNFPYPLRLRVYPTNKSPIRVSLDLSDPVFGKNFTTSRKYYEQWINNDPKIGGADLSFYLLTRNYYTALSESFDTATAWVLHEWLRRGTYLTEHIKYIGIDAEVLDEVNKLQKSLTGPMLDVFNKLGPKLTSPDGPPDFRRMRIANWSLYNVLNGTQVAPAAPAPPSLCNLFSFFKTQWAEAGNDGQSDITSAWHVDNKTLEQGSSGTYLARCGK